MFRRTVFLFTLLAASAQADLIATFSAAGVTDVRRARFPALSVPAGEPATPFLAAGPFDVVWTGKMVFPARRRLAFSFEGEGAATLKIDDQELLNRDGILSGEASKVTRLNAGEHRVEIRYRSKADGTASFRFYLEEEGIPRQTVLPSLFTTEMTEAATLGEQRRAGRLLFTQQNCVKCHTSDEGFGATPMPETGEIGPILIGIGDRVNESWLRRWIADPKALKPTTHMPTLVDVGSAEGRQQSADLAAFLASQVMDTPVGSEVDPQLAQAGGAHFHELGCVACHHPPDVSGPKWESSRVPLNNVSAKFKPGALVGFLKKPEAFHPFTGMPNFKLSDEEASALAAFLTVFSKGKETKDPHDFPVGDAARGAALIESLNCGSCHPGLPMSPEVKAPSLAAVFKKDWSEGGCVAPPERRGKKTPVLNLDDAGRSALVAFSQTGVDSLKRDSSAEFAMRQVESQRCVSCHTIDGKSPLLDTVHSDTAKFAEHIKGLHERVDQSRPQLTLVGEMLYTTAIEAMIAGTAEPRPRPWLGMRMPAFRAHSKPLADAFSRLHGFEPSAPVKVEVDPAMAEIGKTLVGSTGFGCTTCHGVGDLKPTAAFEVEGIHFELVSDRLRHEYYHRWMNQPRSVVPSTKMPKYSDGNSSQRTDVLEGDAYQQYEAIWHYLHSIE